jgi:hypothetical protein
VAVFSKRGVEISSPSSTERQPPMQLKKWLDQWDLRELKFTVGFMEMKWEPRDEDKTAAWELYVEMITRVATQHLVPVHGQDRAALESIYQLFPLTRDIIKKNGRYCINFTRIAVVVLNQMVRPFTTKWHGAFEAPGPIAPEQIIQFRIELLALQVKLRKYTRALADLAGVEDLTELPG